MSIILSEIQQLEYLLESALDEADRIKSRFSGAEDEFSDEDKEELKTANQKLDQLMEDLNQDDDKVFSLSRLKEEPETAEEIENVG